MAQRCVLQRCSFYPWSEFCGSAANAAVQSVCQVTVSPPGKEPKATEGEGTALLAQGRGLGSGMMLRVAHHDENWLRRVDFVRGKDCYADLAKT